MIPKPGTTLTLRDGYDRRVTMKRVAEFEPVTVSQILNGYRPGQFVGLDGTVRNCRTTGSLKTWKRTPGKIRLPFKYGMYECSAWINPNDASPGNVATNEHATGIVYPVKQITEWRDEPKEA